MFSYEQSFFWVLQNRLKKPDQGLLQMMIQVILIVDRQIMLQRVDWILSFLIAISVLSGTNHDHCDSVTLLRSIVGITLSELLGELRVSILHLIMTFVPLGGFRIGFFFTKTFTDHKKTQVDSVLQKITNNLFDVFNSLFIASFDKNLFKAVVNDFLNKGTIVSPNIFNTFAINFIVLLFFGPQ